MKRFGYSADSLYPLPGMEEAFIATQNLRRLKLESVDD
jgi:hypothetical protein